MFDKLDDLLVTALRSSQMSLENRGVTDDPAHFQKLMKEQSDLQPIVDAYKEYKKNKETIEDSLSAGEREGRGNAEMLERRAFLTQKKRVEELEHELEDPSSSEGP